MLNKLLLLSTAALAVATPAVAHTRHHAACHRVAHRAHHRVVTNTVVTTPVVVTPAPVVTYNAPAPVVVTPAPVFTTAPATRVYNSHLTIGGEFSRNRPAVTADYSLFPENGFGVGVFGRAEVGSHNRRGTANKVVGRVGYRFGNGAYSLTPTLQGGAVDLRYGETRAVFGAGIEGRVNLTPRLALFASDDYQQTRNRRFYHQNEANAGLDYNLTNSLDINAKVFRHDGTFPATGVGAGIGFRF